MPVAKLFLSLRGWPTKFPCTFREWLCWTVILVWSCCCRAELVPVEPTVDFGRVSTLNTPQRLARLRVQGAYAVEIVEAKGSCGCVQVEVLTPRIEPGQLGHVRVTLHPLRAPAGPNVWDIVVRYRQRERLEETRLAVSATVIREVSVQPPQLELSASTTLEQDVIVTDVREKPLNIVRLETTFPALTACLVASTPADVCPRQYTIRLKLAAQLPQAVVESMLVIHTDDPLCPQLLVPVRIRRIASTPILVSPPEAILRVSGQEVPSRLFTFRDRQGRPCRIADVESGHPALKCQWSQGTYPVTTLRVSVQPERLDRGDISTVIAVHFTEPEVCTVRIPVRVEHR